MTGAPQADGLGNAKASEPHSGLGPTGAIPSAFTPGPWTYEIFGDSEMGDTFHLGPVSDEYEGVLGTILEGGLVLDDDVVNEANARLIAAAPDLYDALVALVEEREPIGPQWRKAKTAIAKARGDA